MITVSAIKERHKDEFRYNYKLCEQVIEKTALVL